MVVVWWPIGLTRDLGPGQVMAADVGDGVAVWRTVSGALAAFDDRCPHRGMRLSHGFVRGETLSCLYHGWVYGAGGACQRIPAHPDLRPPAVIRAQVWAAVEADGLIWLCDVQGAGNPPALPGWTGLRSMPFDCPPERLIAALPGARVDGDILYAADLCLVLQPHEDRLMVHALTQGGDPVAQSRWLEALRLTAEAAR